MIDKNHKAALRGARNKASGEFWEKMIGMTCKWYTDHGIAEIEKTPEPMRPISSPDRAGRFMAVFTRAAQPDYKGTLAGGKAVVFEAKFTSADRMERSVISEEQEKRLNRHEALGAECFVLITFGFQQFFKVPWNVFRDMKEKFGRKYIKPEDLPEYEITISGGILKFL